MQNRIVAFSPQKSVRKAYKLDGGWQHYRYRVYVAPGKELAVVRTHEDGQRHLEMMKWGKRTDAATVSIGEVTPGDGNNAGFCVIPISMYLLHDVDADHELTPQRVLLARHHYRPISIAGVWRAESGQRHCAVITGTNGMPIALRPGGAMKWLDLNARHSKLMSMLSRVDLPHGVKVIDCASAMPIPSEEMIIEDIPSVDACKFAKFAFALTLPGYDWWDDGEGPERLCRARWVHEETGQWPGDLLQLRNALFHLQRSMHNQGDYSERDYMEYCDLLECIRNAVAHGAQISMPIEDGKNLFFAKRFRRAIAFSGRVSWSR